MHLSFNKATPSLDADVNAFITEIATNKHVPKEMGSLWQDKYLPGILQWLDELVIKGTTAPHDNDDNDDKLFIFIEDTRGTNVPSEIIYQSKKIKLQLEMHFTRNPPFTLLRICELVADPIKAGYDINKGNLVILKFFNSLAKLVVVSSTLNDFPPETFSALSTNGDATSITNLSNGIDKESSSVTMVRIPWLAEVESEPEVSEDSIISEQLSFQQESNTAIDEIEQVQAEPMGDILPNSISVDIESKPTIDNISSPPIESPESNDAHTIPTSPDSPSEEEEAEAIKEAQVVDSEIKKRSSSEAGLEELEGSKRFL
ncbi:uncharacterized protein KQ657_004816 [Scheffersomyces spartinae]|uniref:Uncharacterized protein n=1 Tax=Scheffersomyces spartinae TaxID=45513 RepID=A0A9P7VA07_9ASCO|nr:uncharacterized protein KQ657_004816 [Scheffersomyces spartinae]KAG7194108.1 hypothetical protein KQ657_004816 [Scheffersomyces spartinae]